MILPHLGDDRQVGAEEGGAKLGVGSGGSGLCEDPPLPPTEPDGTLSSHPALLAEPWNGSDDRRGPRVVDILERVDGGLGQI
jgi:hypothetical protein